MTSSNSLIRLLWPCLILCVGVWLRLALYDVHGLEGDDGVALVLTRYDVPTLIDGLRRQELDVHPPLYFLMLKGWIAVAGESLLALRFFNIAAEALTGAFLWALVSQRRSSQAALLALLFWMIAPLLLYSQYTIRMYTLMALWVTAGAWILGRFIRQPRLRTAILLALVCSAALLTHLYGVFLWGAAALILCLQIGRQRLGLRASLSGFLGLMLAALIFLPFGLPMLARFLGGGSLGAQAGSITPLAIPGQLIAAMLTNRAYNPSSSGGLTLIGLLLIGVLWFVSQRRVDASAKQTVWVMMAVCGVGIAGVLALAIGSSVYRPRYAVPFVPLLLGIVAVLIVEFLKTGFRQRILASLLLLTLVMMSLTGMIQNLGRGVYDDWRGAAQFIGTYAQAGDVIIVIPRWGLKAFEYHNQSGLPVEGLFESVTPETDLEVMMPLIENAERVWLVRYQVEGTDPTNRAETWLQERATLTTEVFPTAMQVKLYDLHPTVTALPETAIPLDVQFGDVLRLDGYTLPVIDGPAHDTRLHPPSNWVQVTLYLEALKPLENITLRVRLVDQQGGVWGGALERSADLLHRYPLTAWQTGPLYEVPFDLNLNPDAPSGLYRVEVMVLDVNGVPLPTTGANAGSNWAFAGEYQVK